MAWRDKLEISPANNPFDKLKLSIRGLAMTDRIQGLLNLVVAARIKEFRADRPDLKRVTAKQVKKAIESTLVDVSQNPGRQNFTNREGFTHTLTTSSVLVHLGRGTILHPKEMLFLQGHGAQTRVPRSLKPADLKRLAGEGMALPCLGTCIWAQFLVRGFC